MIFVIYYKMITKISLINNSPHIVTKFFFLVMRTSKILLASFKHTLQYFITESFHLGPFPPFRPHQSLVRSSSLFSVSVSSVFCFYIPHVSEIIWYLSSLSDLYYLAQRPQGPVLLSQCQSFLFYC